MMAFINLLVGLVLGFLVCAWAIEANPLDAAEALGDRIAALAEDAQ